MVDKDKKVKKSSTPKSVKKSVVEDVKVEVVKKRVQSVDVVDSSSSVVNVDVKNNGNYTKREKN